VTVSIFINKPSSSYTFLLPALFVSLNPGSVHIIERIFSEYSLDELLLYSFQPEAISEQSFFIKKLVIGNGSFLQDVLIRNNWSILNVSYIEEQSDPVTQKTILNNEVFYKNNKIRATQETLEVYINRILSKSLDSMKQQYDRQVRELEQDQVVKQKPENFVLMHRYYKSRYIEEVELQKKILIN
jgi:hypothetical protein